MSHFVVVNDFDDAFKACRLKLVLRLATSRLLKTFTASQRWRWRMLDHTVLCGVIVHSFQSVFTWAYRHLLVPLTLLCPKQTASGYTKPGTSPQRVRRMLTLTRYPRIVVGQPHSCRQSRDLAGGLWRQKNECRGCMNGRAIRGATTSSSSCCAVCGGCGNRVTVLGAATWSAETPPTAAQDAAGRHRAYLRRRQWQDSLRNGPKL